MNTINKFVYVTYTSCLEAYALAFTVTCGLKCELCISCGWKRRERELENPKVHQDMEISKW